MTVKLGLFDVNIFEHWLLIKALKPLNDRKFENFQKIQQIERAYTIQIIICRRGTAKWSQSDLKISCLELGDA